LFTYANAEHWQTRWDLLSTHPVGGYHMSVSSQYTR
jgi:hypothetical protein